MVTIWLLSSLRCRNKVCRNCSPRLWGSEDSCWINERFTWCRFWVASSLPCNSRRDTPCGRGDVRLLFNQINKWIKINSSKVIHLFTCRCAITTHVCWMLFCLASLLHITSIELVILSIHKWSSHPSYNIIIKHFLG